MNWTTKNFETLKQDAFSVLDGCFVLDALVDGTSYDEVLGIAVQEIAEQYPDLQKEQVEELARMHVELRTEDEIARHGAPFFSEEVRKDLHRLGYQFNDKQEKELLDFLPPYADALSNLIRETSVEYVAERICDGALFNSPYAGNFACYDPEVTACVLKKIIAPSRP